MEASVRARKHSLGSVNFETWLTMLLLFTEESGDERHKARNVKVDVPLTSSIQTVSVEAECKNV